MSQTAEKKKLKLNFHQKHSRYFPAPTPLIYCYVFATLHTQY